MVGVRAAMQRGAMVHRRNSTVTPCSDTGSWEAKARMDTGEAIAQRNTTHKATQDSRSEAGQLVQGERNRACTGCRTAAQLARKRMTGEKKARQCREVR